MAKNKKSDPQPPTEIELLQQRVDAYMDPTKQDIALPVSPAASALPPEGPLLPAISQPSPAPTVTKHLGTAPEVAPSLLKKAGVSASHEPPQRVPQLVKYRESAKPAPVAEVPVSPPLTVLPSESTAPIKTAPELVPNEAVIPTPKPEVKNVTLPPSVAPIDVAEDLLPIPDTDLLDDPVTDKAVDEIVVGDADALLAAEDTMSQQATPRRTQALPQTSKRPPTSKKRPWFVGLALLLLALLVVGAVPASRSKLLALFVQQNVSITVVDSVTHQAVNSATVSLHGHIARTNTAGQVTFRVAPGSDELTITKQYYRPERLNVLVGVTRGVESKVSLVATGRLVPVTVLNKISGLPVTGAQIEVLNTSASTDAHGTATLVLPADGNASNGLITAPGYTTTKAAVTITSQVNPGNTFSIVPSGKVYFLSNASGTIDVVKTNLDGSERQTVLAGTGHEDPHGTRLVASHDWRYLVLAAKRDAATTTLYRIDAKSDKVTKIDTSAATYQVIGWTGHSLVYDSVSADKSRWQPGREAVKSYDADTDKLTVLDQNLAEGTNTSYGYQSFDNFYMLGSTIAYTTQWYTYDASGNGYSLTGKTDSIRGMSPTGSGKKDYQTFDASGLATIQAVREKPQTIDYSLYYSAANKLSYYQFDGISASAVSTLDPTSFTKNYPNYYASPDNKQTLWSEVRDGHTNILVGDQSGSQMHTIATSGDFAAYGWFTANYILVTKNANQLYILPVTGTKAPQQPLKLADSYAPIASFSVYGN